MSSLDRNFVLAKICVFVKIYVFNMDTYMLSLFSIMYHFTSILSCISHPVIAYTSSPCFFLPHEDERRH